MKKTILFTLLGLALAAGTASADTTSVATYSGSTSIGNMAFTASNNVQVTYKSGDNFRAYVAASSHMSGSRTYGTSSGDANIWYYDQSLKFDSVPSTVPSAGASAAFGSGWSKI